MPNPKLPPLSKSDDSAVKTKNQTGVKRELIAAQAGIKEKRKKDERKKTWNILLTRVCTVDGLGHEEGPRRGRGRGGLAVDGRVGALVGRVPVAEGRAGAAGAAQDGRHRGRLVGQLVLVAAQPGPAVLEVGGVAVGDDDGPGVAVAAVRVRVVGAVAVAQAQVAGPLRQIRRRRWRWQLERGVARVADVVESRGVDYVLAARSLRLRVRYLGLDRALVRVRGLLAQGRRAGRPVVAVAWFFFFSFFWLFSIVFFKNNAY